MKTSTANSNDRLEGHPLVKSSEPTIDLVRLAFKNIFVLGLAAVAGLGLGIMAYKAIGPKYVANSQILVKLKNPIEIREDGNRITVGERSAHVEIIRSPKVVERAVRDGQLQKLATLTGSEEPARDIIDGLKVSRTAGEDHHQFNILNLAYTTTNATDATAILNAVIKAYDEYLQEDAQKNHYELQTLLQQINDDLAPRLAEKTAEYQKFRQEAPLLWKAPPGAEKGPDNVTNIHHQRVQAVAAERVKVELSYEEINSRLTTLRSAIERGESREALMLLVKTFLSKDQQATSQTVVTGATQRERLDSQLIPLLLEEQQLLKLYGGGHPDVSNVRKRIDLVKSYYRQLGVELPLVQTKRNETTGQSEVVYGNDPVETYLVALSQQKGELQNRLVELEKLYQRSSDQAKAFAHYETRDQLLSEELERIKSLHDIVANRIEVLSLAPDKGYQLQQISPARPESDVKHLIKIVGGCLVMTMVVAFGWLFLREMRDTSVRDLNDIRSIVDAPVLGTLPAINNPSKNLAAARETGLAPMLYYYHDPGSPEAEACRSVRATFFVRTADANAQIVQFTSSEPGDGKTTTISNLAISIAQAGKKVLLIDADLRRPMVHRLFGLREDIGLSECLLGEIEFSNAKQQSGIENLDILTAGAIPAKPAELLSSAKLHYLFGEAKRDYDYILIDSPPVLAVSDPCIAAQSVDAVMLVIRMNKNRRPSIKRALEMFESHEIRLLGVVANGLQGHSGEYQYRGGYGGGYQTYPSNKPTTETLEPVLPINQS
ncbi:polysaccharide biosynthesis tyrosine autokinase [Rubinisphaera margarita]|uniref:polysaccharide biosynthesis tyrosine autokinase n=1 Tax=Rubinisphaera margarita TaxID=2909586 RepID=UPI001EE7BA02|nr:polysaccharide biosynthesis tyrosine autokinase [Rubinisphaera margarita]MCG6156715.1 polysaccharide biosynthesis tyrosine autokinase [Rubinisphaera margarita]